MACEVKTFGAIRDFRKVQEYFGLTHDDNWLNAINYAISPTGELIALAQGEKLALLAAFWDNKLQANTYALSWCGELEDPNQIVTALVCLPIHGKAVSVGAEWTCVALGLSSGMVVFYTDSGIKIFSQTFYDDSVLSVKAHSPPRHSEADACIYVVYDQCVCMMRAADLLPTLAAGKHNADRSRNRGAGSKSSPSPANDIVPFQKFKFTREREMIVNDAVVATTGSQTHSRTFDHLVEQCLASGCYTRVSESPGQRALVMGVGAEPYLGFYYAEEGYTTISLRAVAKDVIGMAYKNILGNLFGRTAPSPTETPTPATTPGDEQAQSPAKELLMRTRCRLYDGKRDGFYIALSPSGHLAAITDNLDRVMLVDARRAIVVRVWKGYRDAQCAFVPVRERTLKGVQTHRRRNALFLVIYAPRLGCLEIWALQQGPRVAAFTVSKSGQLAYSTHGLLSVENPSAGSHGGGHGGSGGGSISKQSTPSCACLFLDPSDATVKEVYIPFHYALSESSSQTSRDIHLMRRLRQLLRDQAVAWGGSALGVSVDDLHEVARLAGDFQTLEVRQQCLEMLRKNKQLRPQHFGAVVHAFASAMRSPALAVRRLSTAVEDIVAMEGVEEDNGQGSYIGAITEEEHTSFLNLLDNYERLIAFYVAIKQAIPAAAAAATSNTALAEATTSPWDHLDLPDSDLVIINQLVQLLGDQMAMSAQSTSGCDDEPATGPTSSSKVKFNAAHRDDGDFMDFLNLFQLDKTGCLPLQPEEVNAYGYAAGRLFGELYAAHHDGMWFAEQLKMAAEESTIPSEDLLMLVLHFWLEKSFNYRNCDEVLLEMSRLAAVVRVICEMAGEERVNATAYNAISPWWQAVREFLLESRCSLGLLVAIVCRAVAGEMRRQSSAARDGSCDEGEEDAARWERISHDEAQWGLLIGKLEDVAVLSAILGKQLHCADPVMPEMPFSCPDCSLKFIVSSGKGIVTDLTAKWLNSARIHPSQVLEAIVEDAALEDTETHTATVTAPVNIATIDNTTTTNRSESTDQDAVVRQLSLLREHFPFSLQSGVLLSLMVWHYAVHWSKHLPQLEYLRATLTCLAQFRPADWALKHGMCCMLWNATLRIPLQATARLIQKVGRLPKDKLCQQDIEMPAAIVPEFLDCAVEFIGHFSVSLQHDKRDLQFEEVLAEEGPLPLQFLALQQHHAIKELLQLQTELCSVLQFIAFFQLRVSRPLTTLFDALSNKAFTADINKELNHVLPVPDLMLQQQREHFLCQVISASMDLIREDLESLYVADHMHHMERVNALADSWRLDKSALRRRQVMEMYAHGHDAHGEVLLRSLRDDAEIGRQLLEIAGRRLALYASGSQKAYLNIASVGQQLLLYLDNLRDNSQHPNAIQISASTPADIDLVALTKLMQNIFGRCDRRESQFMHITAQMFDACSLLQDMQ